MVGWSEAAGRARDEDLPALLGHRVAGAVADERRDPSQADADHARLLTSLLRSVRESGAAA